jgi:hypothetical protein
MIDASFDLRNTMWYEAITDAFGAMLAGEARVIGVMDKPPNMSGDLIEIALYEEPLRAAMFRYASTSSCFQFSCPCWLQA